MGFGCLGDGEELDVGIVGLAVFAVHEVAKVDQEVNVTHYQHRGQRGQSEHGRMDKQMHSQKLMPKIMS